MNPKKTSSRLHTIIKSAIVAAILPFVFIYIVVAKPDYRVMNGVAHIALPVVNGLGDLVTWPIRAGGKIIKRVHTLYNLEQENEELRARLDQALADKNKCDIALLENQELERELDIVRESPYASVVADVIFDNSALHHGTFLINRGSRDGIEAGMVVVSFDNTLAGIVIDAGANFARVRSLIDSNTNIAVRIAGSEVYGFLAGNGSNTPTIGFFNDHKFQPDAGVKLVTSGISGVLPPDIFVGKMKNDSDVDVMTPRELSRVMVLKFNLEQNKYK
ncbi:MAG: rod shape-determining protein MreC [Alphaproteobacteria bacterium]|nr:rod shape-determining protein MreC [Alphaproteobacteria bacterium]